MYRIVNRQFGYAMFAAPGTPVSWSDQDSEAAVYNHLDCRETKLRYWRGLAASQGLDPAQVQIEEV